MLLKERRKEPSRKIPSSDGLYPRLESLLWLKWRLIRDNDCYTRFPGRIMHDAGWGSMRPDSFRNNKWSRGLLFARLQVFVDRLRDIIASLVKYDPQHVPSYPLYLFLHMSGCTPSALFRLHNKDYSIHL